MDNIQIYMCEICGNVVVRVNDGKCDEGCMKCCGQSMTKLEAKTEEGLAEKHLPVVDMEDGKVIVTVGEVMHPMEEEHYIHFIILEKESGFEIKYLNPGDEPKVSFTVSEDEKLHNVYEYCNLHGLWKVSL